MQYYEIFGNFQYSMNRLDKVLSTPPLSVTKHFSRVWRRGCAFGAFAGLGRRLWKGAEVCCKSMNILLLHEYILVGGGGAGRGCQAAGGGGAGILLKGYINKIEDILFCRLYSESLRRLQKDFLPGEASWPDWLR